MEHRIKFPFIQRWVSAVWDVDFSSDNYHVPEVKEWFPTLRFMANSSGSEWFEADGEGYMVITEISRHELPRPYPARVFYTRKWIDPDGKEFGKGKLHISRVTKFNKIIGGYFGEEYEVIPREPELEKLLF